MNADAILLPTAIACIALAAIFAGTGDAWMTFVLGSLGGAGLGMVA